MRTCIGIAVVVAIGLIWSVAVMFEWIPVNSAEMSAATSPHAITVGEGKVHRRPGNLDALVATERLSPWGM
jgi:hypothetical protein